MDTTPGNKKEQTSYIMEARLWPKMFSLVCCYCGGKEARKGNDIEGVYSHYKCHDEACR